MTTIRRRTPAPAKAEAPAAAPAAEPAAKPPGPTRRRVIPIQKAAEPAKAETSPVARRIANKAYVPPEDEEGGSGTDYKAVTDRYMSRIRNPKTAIRARCIQCCNGQVKEVQLCPCVTCALHPFRMGVNPFHKRTGTKRGATPGSIAGDDEDDE